MISLNQDASSTCFTLGTCIYVCLSVFLSVPDYFSVSVCIFIHKLLSSLDVWSRQAFTTKCSLCLFASMPGVELSANPFLRCS